MNWKTSSSIILMVFVSLSIFFKWTSVLGFKLSPLALVRLSSLAIWAGEDSYAFLGIVGTLVSICMSISAALVSFRRWNGIACNDKLPLIFSAVLSALSFIAGTSVTAWAVIIPLFAVISNILWKNAGKTSKPVSDSIRKTKCKIHGMLSSSRSSDCSGMRAKASSGTEYVYADCGRCRAHLRLPAHKGLINVYCPSCNSTFKFFSN